MTKRRLYDIGKETALVLAGGILVAFTVVVVVVVYFLVVNR